MNGINTERFYNLEEQSYVMYLQLNAMTALLVKNGVIDKDTLVADMDAMNSEITAISDEIGRMEEPAANA